MMTDLNSTHTHTHTSHYSRLVWTTTIKTVTVLYLMDIKIRSHHFINLICDLIQYPTHLPYVMLDYDKESLCASRHFCESFSGHIRSAKPHVSQTDCVSNVKKKNKISLMLHRCRFHKRPLDVSQGGTLEKNIWHPKDYVLSLQG